MIGAAFCWAGSVIDAVWSDIEASSVGSGPPLKIGEKRHIHHKWWRCPGSNAPSGYVVVLFVFDVCNKRFVYWTPN